MDANLLGTKFLGNCMCYHGRVIIEGCITKCVILIDKYINISEAALIYLCDDICMTIV